MKKTIHSELKTIVLCGALFSVLAASAEDLDALLDAMGSSSQPAESTVRAVPDMSSIKEPEQKSETKSESATKKKTEATAQNIADLSIWDSKKFQDEFMGSYGVNTDIEPSLSAVEYEKMQKVLDAMSKDNDQSKAIELLKKNCGDSSSARFEFTLGNIYFQQNKLDEALNLYGQAIKKFPGYRRAYKNAGLIYVRRGDFKKALPYLTKTISLGETTSLAYGLLGYAYASTGNDLCAESAYRQAILLDPATLDWQLGLARSLFKEQKYGDAVSLCDTLIKKQPDNADFWLLQANAYLGLKQPTRAAENYEYVNSIGKASAKSMTMLGDIYVNDSRYDMAADAYLHAYALDTNSDPAKPLRAAKILASRGALEQARRILNRVAEHKSALRKDHLQELLKLQARIAVSEGGGDKAVKILEEVVSNDPLDGEALILLGQHYGRSQPEKAVFYYERAEGVDKYEAQAKLYHGQLLVNESKFQDALPLLRRANELKPRQDLADYIKQVERIAKSRG